MAGGKRVREAHRLAGPGQRLPEVGVLEAPAVQLLQDRPHRRRVSKRLTSCLPTSLSQVASNMTSVGRRAKAEATARAGVTQLCMQTCGGLPPPLHSMTTLDRLQHHDNIYDGFGISSCRHSVV
jgi:hypothetical protein